MRNTFSELLANRGVILGCAYNRIVFIHGEALVGNRLLQRGVRLSGDALFVGRRRLRDPSFVALPDAGHLPDSRRSGIQLLIRNLSATVIALGVIALEGEPAVGFGRLPLAEEAARRCPVRRPRASAADAFWSRDV